MQQVFDRILGMLYGCAIGDSFGMPAEMWDQEKVRATFGYISDFIPSPVENEISGGFKAGETTDDTIVAFITAQALIRMNGQINPIDIVNSIEDWSVQNPKSKTIIGPSTRKAFEAIHAGSDINEAGKNGITNGAGTRVAPVGVILKSDEPELIADKTVKVCMATHNTNYAIAGASAMAAAVAHGIEGKPLKDILECILRASAAGGKRGHHIGDESVSDRIKASFERSDRIADDDKFIRCQFVENGSSLPMIETAPSALAIAYRSNGDIMRAARLATNMGGDTDTVAAMACMVVGAHVGALAIPESARKLVSTVNSHPFEEVAKALFQLRIQLTED